MRFKPKAKLDASQVEDFRAPRSFDKRPPDTVDASYKARARKIAREHNRKKD